MADTGTVVGPLDALWIGIANWVASRIPQSIVAHWHRDRSYPPQIHIQAGIRQSPALYLPTAWGIMRLEL